MRLFKLFKTKKIQRILYGDMNPSAIDTILRALQITKFGRGADIEKMTIFLEIEPKEEVEK